MAHPPAALGLEIAKLLGNPKHSDLILECERTQWGVHKLVLCSQSSFFAKACEGKIWTEAKAGRIHLADDTAEVVDAMLQYLYTSDYSYTCTTYGALFNRENITLDLKVYILADKLDVRDLVAEASARFCANVKNSWSKPAFARAVRDLYQNAPEGDRSMRKAAVDISAMHAKELLEKDRGAEFRKVVDEITAFGMEFQLASVKSRKEKLEEDPLYVCNVKHGAFTTARGSAEVVCPFCGWRLGANGYYSMGGHQLIVEIRGHDYK